MVASRTFLLLTLLTLNACSENSNAISNLNQEKTCSVEKSIPKIKLEGPFQQLIYAREENIFDAKKKVWEAEYQPVKITIAGKVGEGEVRARGGISFCNSFPQLKLKLSKNFPLEGEREFKIITHGTYKLDPNTPVTSESCHQKLITDDLRESKRLQNKIYELSAVLLDFHLKVNTYDIQYLDNAFAIDLNERGYFLEDKDAAAKRYKLKPAKFTGLSSKVAWRNSSGLQGDVIDAIVDERLLDLFAKSYLELAALRPELGAVELGREAGLMFDDSLEEQFYKEAQEQIETSIEKLKGEQIALLQKMDKKVLANALLFNVMIGNKDWNVFGLTKHGDAIKNVELLEDAAGTLYTIPYDFDYSDWVLRNVPTWPVAWKTIDKGAYIDSLEAIVKDHNNSLSGFLLSEIKTELLPFANRVEIAAAACDFEPAFKESATNFVLALRDFHSTLP